jgi:hypothetical protein
MHSFDLDNCTVSATIKPRTAFSLAKVTPLAYITYTLTYFAVTT